MTGSTTRRSTFRSPQCAGDRPRRSRARESIPVFTAAISKSSKTASICRIDESRRRRSLGGEDRLRVLRRDRREDREGVAAVGLDRLDIGLDPRAAARVGSRDGQDLGNHRASPVLPLIASISSRSRAKLVRLNRIEIAVKMLEQGILQVLRGEVRPLDPPSPRMSAKRPPQSSSCSSVAGRSSRIRSLSADVAGRMVVRVEAADLLDRFRSDPTCESGTQGRAGRSAFVPASCF